MSLIADRYEVLGTLGSGGVAEVLRVSDDAIPGRQIALKVAREPSFNTELSNEFLALSRVQHPNLPQVFDFLPNAKDGCAAYTLEEVVGDTADVAVGAADHNTITSIATGLLRALAHIHASKLVHGDVHPHNVIYDAETDVVKLLDLTPDALGGTGMGAIRGSREACRRKAIPCNRYFFGRGNTASIADRANAVPGIPPHARRWSTCCGRISWSLAAIGHVDAFGTS